MPKRSVLVVEDSKLQLMTISLPAEEEGYVVYQAASGEEGP